MEKQLSIFDIPPKKIKINNNKKALHQWLKENNAKTLVTWDVDPPWAAWVGDLNEAIETDNLYYGLTEEQAVENLKQALKGT